MRLSDSVVESDVLTIDLMLRLRESIEMYKQTAELLTEEGNMEEAIEAYGSALNICLELVHKAFEQIDFNPMKAKEFAEYVNDVRRLAEELFGDISSVAGLAGFAAKVENCSEKQRAVIERCKVAMHVIYLQVESANRILAVSDEVIEEVRDVLDEEDEGDQ